MRVGKQAVIERVRIRHDREVECIGAGLKLISQRELNRKATLHLRWKRINIERNRLFSSGRHAKHPWEVAQPICVQGASCLPQPIRTRHLCVRFATASRTRRLDKSRMARTWALELGLPRIVDSILVKRLGMPEDVARAVLFFAAPEAGFVTGQTLFVCGGTSVGSIVY